MHAAQMWSTLSIAVLLSAAGGDLGPGAQSGAASRAGARSGAAVAGAAAAAALPRFALFGWVSPPVESTTAERIAEMAALRFNVLLPAWNDSGKLGDNLERMRFAADHGMQCLAWDERFARVYFGGEMALLDTIVADYADEPGFLGYYFTDEPMPPEFPLLARIYADLRARDPVHPAWDDIHGIASFSTLADWEQYARQFIETVGPSVLCDNYYDFLTDRDRGGFMQNAVALRTLADQYGIPFWSVLLLVQHGPYRSPTPGELRWQVAHLLAYGARGIGYFTYWTPAPDPNHNWGPAVIGYDGVRSPWYDMLVAYNPYVRAAGEALAGLTWLSTQHSGSLPRGGTAFAPDAWVRAVEGRAAIGRFAGLAGERYLLVANSDSLSARSPALTLPGTRRVFRLGASGGSWTELAVEPELDASRVVVALEAGDFALLKLETAPAGAPGPVLALGPNPARGVVRFAVSAAGPGARVEIFDAQGRAVWSSAISPGSGPVAWRGERDGGGTATPGIYLARVSDSGGATNVRFSWLGGR